MEVQQVTAEDDFEAIGNIYASSWKAAYRGIVPQDFLDSLSAERWAPMLRETTNPLYVLLDRGRYIGVSSVCPARDESMAGWGEIVSFYLLPERWGAGCAKPFMESVVSAIRERGFAQIYLWVLRENRRARRFYEKCGFVANGDTGTMEIGGRVLTEVRYIHKAK